MQIFRNRENILEIVSAYINGAAIKKIKKIYKIDNRTIVKFLKQEGVPLRKVGLLNRRYFFNESVFSHIDTEEKAYWLGFLYADGNVSNNSLTLKISSKDRAHLLKFKNNFKFPQKIYNISVKKNEKIFLYSSIVLTSDTLIQDFKKLGCIRRKTYKIRFPAACQVPRCLLNHFVRGYFDGDGCITSSISGGKRYFRVCILSNRHFLLGLCKYLKSMGLGYYRMEKEKRANVYYVICYGFKNLEILKNLMYHNATVYLPRKRAVFDLASRRNRFKSVKSFHN